MFGAQGFFFALRPKPGFFASCDCAAGLKKARIPFTRRSCLISAETPGILAWDALRLLPPSSCLWVLKQAHGAFPSDPADKGFVLPRSLSDTQDVNMRLRRALLKGRVSDRASGVLSTLQAVLRSSNTTVARAMFSRAVNAHALTPIVGGASLEAMRRIGRACPPGYGWPLRVDRPTV